MAVEPEQIQQVPLLSKLSKRELRTLAGQMRERSIPAGGTVVTQGDTSVGFFVILSGEAQVIVDGEPRGTLTTGEYFGEIALISDTARTATVTAITDLEVAGLTAWQFRPLIVEHPEMAWTLLETLAARLSA